MAQRLKSRVNVDGTWYEPGTVPPAEVAKRITNPNAWLDRAPATSEEDDGGQGEGSGAGQGGASDRPRGNASRDDWAAYATGRGIEFDENANRDEIRAAVDAAEAGAADEQKG